MMQIKNSYKGYAALFVSLMFLISLSSDTVEKVRGKAISFFSPVWNGKKNASVQEELKRLQLENQLLHSELERIQEFAIQEQLIHDLAKEFFALHLQAIPARVIYRAPSLWNSSLWLNVGFADNEKLEQVVIAKNSPVLLGTSVVGVVDYVGEHQSRVRLITDSGLNPSVRVARGSKQKRNVIEKIQALIDVLDEEALISQLQKLKKELLEENGNLYLAKGELSGSSFPMWRTQGHVLKGTGFNYDFADSEGPARDLRTGLPLDSPLNKPPIALIRKNDLLVTTGMDGVFPSGLPIARVITVNPLKEGDYCYEIEAVPTAENLNEVQTVLVLPPVGYNPDDKPPVIGG